MPATVIHNIRYLIDGTGKPLTAAPDAPLSLRFENGVITDIGNAVSFDDADEVIEAGDRICYPGWVNTHHHLFQSVLKGVASGLNERLFGWHNNVTSPRVCRFDRQSLISGVRLGLAELLLSGTTSCADHHYIYYRGVDPAFSDLLFEEAEALGVRFILCRGGELKRNSDGDFPSHTPPENLDAYLQDIERLHGRFHQPGGNAMRRIVVAPTTPIYSVEPDWLPELASFSRSLGLHMHSHLSETEDFLDFCRQQFDLSPVEFVEKYHWLGPDVWFAHMVHVSPEEMRILGETATGISHCPASNCRLGSGFAPVLAMEKAGVTISIGVDGSASNEQASMLAELRLAWLIQRALNRSASDVTVENIVHWGSAGGARVVGLANVGTLEVGKAADLVLYKSDRIANLGVHELVYSPVLCGEANVDLAFCNGRKVVENHTIPGLDMEKLAADVRQSVKALRQ